MKDTNIISKNINDIDCKYTHGQRLKIKRGFYKGNYVTIRHVEQVGKNIIYECNLVLGNKDNSIKLDEDSLETYFKIPFMN